jgi:hypothetical protein
VTLEIWSWNDSGERAIAPDHIVLPGMQQKEEHQTDHFCKTRLGQSGAVAGVHSPDQGNYQLYGYWLDWCWRVPVTVHPSQLVLEVESDVRMSLDLDIHNCARLNRFSMKLTILITLTDDLATGQGLQCWNSNHSSQLEETMLAILAATLAQTTF